MKYLFVSDVDLYTLPLYLCSYIQLVFCQNKHIELMPIRCFKIYIYNNEKVCRSIQNESNQFKVCGI